MQKKKKSRTKLKNQGMYHLMLLPGVIVTFIFCYIPLYGVIIAFQDYNVGMGFSSPWVGFKNFEFLFKQPAFIQTIWNTLYIAVFKLLLGIAVPVTFAVLLNEMVSDKLKRVYQTLIYIPNFLSWIIMAGVMIEILGTDGMINGFLGKFGIDPVSFLGDPKIFPWTMIISDIWKGFGYGTIVYLAALTGIDPGLYESATLDGATRWQKIRFITVPLLKPTVVLMLVLAPGGVLNAGFDQVYNLYAPVVYSTGDIIDTYVYRLGIVQAQYSVGAAVGLFKSVISAILVAVSYVMADKVAGYRIL
ncbi:MAG: ABC transporter permease subunit [Lachnospiraceae bacterium]|nr:ABC transporter permease subunit [Lachnospiraceae bacterium]